MVRNQELYFYLIPFTCPYFNHQLWFENCRAQGLSKKEPKWKAKCIYTNLKKLKKKKNAPYQYLKKPSLVLDIIKVTKWIVHRGKPGDNAFFFFFHFVKL